MGTIASTPSLPSVVPSGAPLSTLTFFLGTLNVMEMEHKDFSTFKFLVVHATYVYYNDNIVD